MSRNEYEHLSTIKEFIRFGREVLNWTNRDIKFWIEGIIFGISADYSNEFITELEKIRDFYFNKEE